MKNLKIILLLFLSAILFSCSKSYKLIEKNKIQGVFILNSSPTFKGYYYQGTDSEFHYFSSKWELKKDMLFKLRKEDLLIKEPYDFEMNEIRFDLFKTEKEFGNNEFYELFIIQQ
ncbi:hypothetical protein [uncultured Aquimarina sp.]|uniref:hypothetical protein n=1 Tax=uncultured Aquimarina sp. TaxID=575652 RepID=UPI002601BD4E|nr:hypothetical protein [uncultured Aquimarina sp.]